MTAHVRSVSNTISIDTCAACGCQLTGSYYMLADRNERYCPTCIRTRPRCDSCGAPLGQDSWQLHDGRYQCARCHRSAVYAPRQARRVYQETVQNVALHFRLLIDQPVAFRLVDAPTLREIRGADTNELPSSPGRTLGLYQRQNTMRVIYLLYGIPLLLFRTTVAHEYAHAWQDQHCSQLQNHVLREGFAEWVAYRHLLTLGCTRAADQMLQAHHPYRPMLQHVLTLEQQIGTLALINYIRHAE